MPTAATRIGSILSTGLLAGILLFPMGMTGCRTSQKTTSSPNAPEMRPEDIVLKQLEAEYAIGPRKARSLGYRIGWQAPQPNKNLLLHPQYKEYPYERFLLME